jgi:hypothetical protein
MTRILIAFVAFVLSGVPAATVVCDLVLCPPPRVESKHADAPRRGCHEHSTTSGGARIAAAAHGCAHLLIVAPFVPSGSRQLVDVTVVAPLIDATYCLSAASQPQSPEALPHGPPRRSSPPPTPLRI